MNNSHISIDKPSDDFTHHLSLLDNERIIFSAKFGTGKTYFLKQFFKNHPNYETIFLAPINYSISRNEDIFELIKYDVLFHLMSKDVDFKKVEINNIKTILSFSDNNIHKLFSPFLKLIPIIGGGLSDICTQLFDLSEKFEKEKTELEKGDKVKALEFLRDFKDIKGNLYENDFYTQLIQNLVEQLKKDIENPPNTKKETVLVIDDLDRIDPEHIFRILNVFAAHFDINNNGNKFNFDKVILVCDIENIRRIFANKYGADVDFTGYIDKFYSKEVFKFNNREAISQIVSHIVKTINFDVKNKWFDISVDENIFHQNFSYIITEFILSQSINIRSFLKYENLHFRIKKYKPNLTLKGAPDFNQKSDILILIDLLLFIFEDIDKLILACERCSHNNEKSTENDNTSFLGYILPILDMEQHKFVSGTKSFTYQQSEADLQVTYNLQDCGEWGERKRCQIHRISNNSNANISEYDYFAVFKKLLLKIKNKKLIPNLN